ncbi:MAG: serine/threonine protein kinase, partial [Deltaproteobacteria bacterium]|nr:serine/threonine protein kinase [Deltaproteobacteria bacterium]
MEPHQPARHERPQPMLDLHGVLASADSADELEAAATLCSIEAKMFGGPRRVTVSRYELGELLGRGGAGDVYLARDPQLDRTVAVKLLRPPEGLALHSVRRRFLREARAIARLSHPNVVKVFDVGEFRRADLPDIEIHGAPPDGRDVFIVMERVGGENLDAWIARTRPSWQQVLSCLVAAGRGLAAAHADGIVHRDFKPSNVLVDDDGGVKVIDFGLALYVRADPDDTSLPSVPQPRDTLPRSIDLMLTQAGQVVGTPMYMAPEQHAGRPTGPAADQFSLCATLYEALFGQPAYSGDSHESLHRAKRCGPPSPPPDTPIPRTIVRALVRGLEPEPRERWPSIEALLGALAPPCVRRKSRWWLGAGAAVVTTAIVAAPSHRAPPPCDPAERIGAVWDQTRRAGLLETLTATGLSYAPQTHRQLGARVDAYSDGWRKSYQAICLDASLSSEVRDGKMACLSRQLGELDVLLAVIGRGDPAALEHATGAVWSLPSPQQCTDPDNGTGGAGSSLAHAAAQHMDGRLGEGLVELRALRRAGLYKTGMDKGAAL